jgi:alpha-L-fucosidase
MKWWHEAKFGMFVHWGVYAVPAGEYRGKEVPGLGEWIMHDARIPVAEYRGYAGRFDPAKYDPDAWAQLARDAGMRYVVITSKHHDGFALFDSAASDWNAVKAAPAGRDLIAPLAAAVRNRGMKFGLYYSQAQDWTNPGGAKAGYKAGDGWDPAQKGDYDAYLDGVAVPQVREILTRYKPDVLWWDTPVDMTPARAAKFTALLSSLAPRIVQNNRLGGGVRGDTETPEQTIPATGYPGRDWETCMTMNDTWGFKRADHRWKPADDLTRKLIDIASKGGNFLLNVGPTAEGEIPPESVERLRAVGRWMKTNGEAIYGTTAGPFSPAPEWGRATRKGDTLYLHVFAWPADGRLVVPGLKGTARSARLLAAGGAKLEARPGDDGLTIAGLPAAAPDPVASVIKLEMAGPFTVERRPIAPAPDGTLTLSAALATIENPENGDAAQVEEKGGRPNVGFWTDARSRVSWNARFARPGTYEVTAEVAAPAATRFTVSAGGGAVLNAETPATGDYDTFKTVTLGQLTVPQAGPATITVRPADPAAWRPLNLRSLTLRPVGQ